MNVLFIYLVEDFAEWNAQNSYNEDMSVIINMWTNYYTLRFILYCYYFFYDDFIS